MEIIDFATLLPIIGAITVLTNIIVQVLKQVTKDKLPSNLVALAVAMVLTLGAGAAYAQIKGHHLVSGGGRRRRGLYGGLRGHVRI